MIGIAPLAALLALRLLGAAPCAPPVGCTCIERSAPALARETSDAVFLGRVTGVREVVLATDESGVGIPWRAVTLRVERVWKGELGDTVVVTTGWGGGDCGYPFEERSEYLVYARRVDGELTTSICSRTRAAVGARAEMAALGRSVARLRP